MLHVKFYLKLTWGERPNKTLVSGKLILFDSDFTIVTTYMKLSRV